MEFGTPGTQNPAKPQSAEAALKAAASAVGMKPIEALAYAENNGLGISASIPQIPALGAYLTAHPGSTVGQAAASLGDATPAQATKIDGAYSVAGGTTGQPEDNAKSTGLVSDIVGDVFEVFYPWVMWSLASAFALVGLVILVVAVIKSPAGKKVLDLGAKAALAGLL